MIKIKKRFIISLLCIIFIITSLIGIIFIKNVNAILSTDFNNPSIVENIDNSGGSEFTTIDNIKVQNDLYGVSIIQASDTDWIRCSGFNFNLLKDSIINGIEVQIDDWAQMAFAQDVYLVLNSDTIGIDKEIGTWLSWVDNDIYRVYGSFNDMWNTELTDVDIESSTFGIQIFYNNTFILFPTTVSIDNIQIKVFYTEKDNGNGNDIETNIDFIIILGILTLFSSIILILMFTIIITKKRGK